MGMRNDNPLHRFLVSINPEDTQTDTWSVSLPHQCDNWTIAEGTKEETILGLRKFIDKANHALTELYATEPCQHEWAQNRAMGMLTCQKCDAMVWEED